MSETIREQDTDKKEGSGGAGSAVGTAVLLAILLAPIALPSMLIGYSAYGYFFKKRHFTPTTVVLCLSPVILLGALGLMSMGGTTGIMAAISETKWTQLALMLVFIDLILGSLVAIVFSVGSAVMLRYNPELLSTEGWTKNFQYALTLPGYIRYRKDLKALRDGSLGDEERAPIGMDEVTKKPVYRYYTESVRHTMITGNPGTGKSIAMLNQIRNDIKTGKHSIGIDFKKDPELTSKIAYWCWEFGVDFYHVSGGKAEQYNVPQNPRGQSYFNPLQGGAAEQAGMLLGMRDYDTSAAKFKGDMQSLLETLTSAIENAKMDAETTRKVEKALNYVPIDWDAGGIITIYTAIKDSMGLQELAIRTEGTESQDDMNALYQNTLSRSSSDKAQLEELQTQLRTIRQSTFGRWLRNDPSGQNTVNLYELTKAGARPCFILFSFDSDSEEEISSYIGSLVFRNIVNLSARRRKEGMKNMVMVYADEFQAVPPSAVTALLAKSRASRIAVTLSLQNFSQITVLGGDDVLEAITNTCSNFFVHSGSTHGIAETLSGLLGKQKITTYRASRRKGHFLFDMNPLAKRNALVNSSEEEVWICPPSEFMRLSTPVAENGWKSTAIIINKSGVEDPDYRTHQGGLHRLTWMVADEEVLKVPGSIDPNVDNGSNLSQPVIRSVVEPTEEELRREEDAREIEARLMAQGLEPVVTNEPNMVPHASNVATNVSNMATNEATMVSDGDEDEDDGGFEIEPIDQEPYTPTPRELRAKQRAENLRRKKEEALAREAKESGSGINPVLAPDKRGRKPIRSFNALAKDIQPQTLKDHEKAQTKRQEEPKPKQVTLPNLDL